MLHAAANVSAAHAAGALLVNEEGRAALGEGEVRCALLVIERASDLHCKRVRDAGCVRIGQERRVRLFIMQNTPRAPNNPKLSEAG